MQANREAAIAFTLNEEGGLVDDPLDSGGITNRGITLGALEEYRGCHCTMQDIKTLTQVEAELIYRTLYWETVAGDELPNGIDLMVFDFGVTAGPGRAVMMLQRMIGAHQDGIAGPVTIKAAQCVPPVLWTRIAALDSAQEAFYHGRVGWGHDGRGWTARLHRRQTLAMKLTLSTHSTVGV